MTTRQISVLVVEDEPLVRLGIVGYLEDDGFAVFEATNADEAIRLLAAHGEIRVMFTDIDMPGSMDGLKLAAAVRDRWPPVKIVVTSGHRSVTPDDLPDSTTFFAKPYNPDEIASVFRRLSEG
jgi:CheY-like chemotaxis protein